VTRCRLDQKKKDQKKKGEEKDCHAGFPGAREYVRPPGHPRVGRLCSGALPLRRPGGFPGPAPGPVAPRRGSDYNRETWERLWEKEGAP
jgi:hypothetical protein